MTRFFSIKVGGGAFSFEEALESVNSLKLSKGRAKGFEIEAVNETELVVSWWERITVLRELNNDIFGRQKFREISILNFGVIVDALARNVVVINPPQGRHKTQRVLRSLFAEGNFVFRQLDIGKSLENLERQLGATISAIETFQINLKPGVDVAMLATGTADLCTFFEEEFRGKGVRFKAVHVDCDLASGVPSKVALSQSGLVRLSHGRKHEDVLMLSRLLVYAEG